MSTVVQFPRHLDGRWKKRQVTWFRIVGLDLGQAGDHACAAVLERDLDQPRGVHYCRALRQFDLGTDYCDVVEAVMQLPWDVLVPDFCGVGRPVVDFIRREQMRVGHQGKVRPVATVASNAKARTKSEPRGVVHSMPKIELVTSLQLMQQQGLLRLPDTLEAKKLIGEIGNYQLRYSAKGNQQFGNKPGAGNHDDLVSALGLACWWAQRFGGKKLAIWCG